MDAVYILGSGSLCNDLEIKYSVRALALNMLDLRNVWVIGGSAAALPHARHVAARDESQKRWKNAFLKTRLACQYDDISDEFLLMNDDFFTLVPFHGAEYPFYAVKNADGGASGRLCFQIHAPMRIKKDWYKHMPFDPDAPGDFSPRSFYANFYGAPPTYVDDCILRHGTGMPDFQKQIAGREFFSTDNDIFLDPEFVLWLDTMFSEPSRFE